MKAQLRIVAILLATASALPYQQAFSGQLEEIVVTATRRSESLQTVPISITAITSEEIERAGLEGVFDIALVTPGLQMGQSSVAWVPYIRGIGTQNTAAGSEAGIATYIDGVYLSSPYGLTMSFNNIERVEVLKGPQGTLFGRNSTGGLINIITRDPSHETTAFGKVGYGTYDTIHGKLYATTGITDNLAADIAFNYSDQGEGYGDNVFTGKEIDGNSAVGFRTKWLYENDGTRVTFAADYQKNESAQGDNRSILPGSAVGGFLPLTDFYDVQLNTEAGSKVENSGIMLKIQKEFNAFDLQSISSYRETEVHSTFDNDGSPINIVSVVQDIKVETFTQEIQLTSNGSHSFDWIAGIFYMDDMNGYQQPHGIKISGAVIDPTLVTSLGFVHPVETTSVAIYGETTFNLADSLRLITGIRYTHDEKEISGGINVILEADGSTLLTIPSPSGSDSWGEVTGRLGLEYDFSDDTMLYATYNRGFRSGAYESSTSITGIAVEPEIADAYEIGFKSDLFDSRVRLNAALFYTDYQDLQVFLSTGGTSFLLNAGAASILGAELDLRANITDNLSINLGVNFLDTEYSEFVDVDNCTTREGTTTVQVACSPEGNKIALAPDLTFNLGMHYETAASFGVVGASFNYSWSDEFNWSFIGRLKEDAYGVLNGQLFWETEDERYGITLYGRNLTDEEYSTFSVAQASVGDHYAAAAPLTYGVEFKFKF